jgi:hypothetical protein
MVHKWPCRTIAQAIGQTGAGWLQVISDFGDAIETEWGNPPFRVDIITRISGVEFDDAWSRRLIHTVNAETGLTAPWSAEDLIANKQSAGQEEGREQDIADAAAVHRAVRRPRIPDEG